jgi:hypothetical protein
LVHLDSNFSQLDHKVTALLGGGWVVTWTTRDSDQLGVADVYARVFGTDGEPKSIEFLVNEYTEGTQNDISVDALSDGTFLVSWTSYGQLAESQRSLHYRQFDSSGIPLTDEMLLNASINTSGGDQSISVLAGGGLVVAWKDVNDQRIKQEQFDADFQPVGDIERVSDIYSYSESFVDTHALSDGGWLSVWRSSASVDGTNEIEIFIRRFLSDGSPVGQASLVSLFGSPITDFASSTISNPDVEVLVDGSIVIAWEASGADGIHDYDSDIYMQRFGSDGIPLGDGVRVNELEAFSQNDAQVLALPDGGWLVSWTDEAIDSGGGVTTGTERKIVAQRYGADGNKVGDNLIISSSPEIRQQFPEMALLSDGTILVTWWAYDFVSDESRADILQQIFAVPPIAFSAEYDENREASDIVATVTAPDIIDVTSYEITSGDPGGATPWFAINLAGEVTLTAEGLTSTANDYEEGANGFVLSVQATGNGGNVGEPFYVSLQVDDIGDVAPSIVLTSKIGLIPENFDTTERFKVADIVIIDDSAGTNVLSLSGDDADHFEIIGSVLYLRAGTELDYESGNTTLDVTVEVDDASLGGNPDSSASMSIGVRDVEEQAPVIEPLSGITYNENLNTTDILATVIASDNVAVTGFEIISGDPGGPTTWFGINNRGEITLTDAGIVSAANDYETGDNSFSLSIVASDAVGNSSLPNTVDLIVADVDDEAPIGQITLSATYDENRGETDVLVVVTATDNVRVTGYQIVKGDPGGETPWFEINAVGEITLTDAGIAMPANDHERGESSFTLSIAASDAAGNVGVPIAVTLTVADVGISTPLSAEELDQDNIVFGSVHEDHIDAGAGSDVLFGGLGADVFIFDTGYGFDIILDFSSGEDIVDLVNAGVTEVGDLTILDYESGKGASVVYSNEGDEILLLGVDYTSLTIDDFAFV